MQSHSLGGVLPKAALEAEAGSRAERALQGLLLGSQPVMEACDGEEGVRVLSETEPLLAVNPKSPRPCLLPPPPHFHLVYGTFPGSLGCSLYCPSTLLTPCPLREPSLTTRSERQLSPSLLSRLPPLLLTSKNLAYCKRACFLLASALNASSKSTPGLACSLSAVLLGIYHRTWPTGKSCLLNE